MRGHLRTSLRRLLLPALLLCTAPAPSAAQAQAWEGVSRLSAQWTASTATLSAGAAEAALELSVGKFERAATITVTFGPEDLPGGGKAFFAPQSVHLSSEQEDSTQRVRVFVRNAGSHARRITLRAHFVSETGAEREQALELFLTGAPPALHLELHDEAGNRVRELREGETGMLHVRAEGLQAGQTWEALLSGGRAEDAGLSTNAVVLRAEEPLQRVRVRVREDGEAEGRERVRWRAQVRGQAGLAAEEEMVIPRHGYAAQSVRLSAARLRSGESAEWELQLNAPTSASRVTLRYRAVHEGLLRGGVLEGALRVQGRLARGVAPAEALQQEGSYELRLEEALFAEEESRGLDQRRLPLPTETGVRVRVWGAVRMRVSLSDDALCEGERAFVRLEGENLWPGQTLEAFLKSAHSTTQPGQGIPQCGHTG